MGHLNLNRRIAAANQLKWSIILSPKTVSACEGTPNQFRPLLGLGKVRMLPVRVMNRLLWARDTFKAELFLMTIVLLRDRSCSFIIWQKVLFQKSVTSKETIPWLSLSTYQVTKSYSASVTQSCAVMRRLYQRACQRLCAHCFLSYFDDWIWGDTYFWRLVSIFKSVMPLWKCGMFWTFWDNSKATPLHKSASGRLSFSIKGLQDDSEGTQAGLCISICWITSLLTKNALPL